MTRSTRTFTFTVNAPLTRRSNVGHWVDVPRFEQEAFGVDQAKVQAGINFTGPTQPGVPRTGVVYSTSRTTGAPFITGNSPSYPVADRLNIPGVKGVIMRYRWRELESGSTTQNATFTFDRVAGELAQCQAIGDARGTRFGFFLFIEVRAFDDVNPAPAYLQVFTTRRASDGNIDIWRWNSTVRTRFARLVQALAAQFDSHPCWDGIAVSETSTGGADITATGYSPEAFRDALIAESSVIASSCINGRHLFYHNFLSATNNSFPSGQNSNTYLNTVVQSGVTNGAMIVSGPDILPNKASLDPVYARLVAFNGALPIACSAQNDSHHWRASVQAVTPPGTPDTMQTIFDYGRNTLKLNYMAWTWRRTGTGNRFSDDAVVINGTPTWQPTPGWVPPA